MHTKIFFIAAALWGYSVSLAQVGGVENADVLEKAIEREAVPAEVLADAVRATQEVGDQTLKGDFVGVVEKLYPRYRDRAAKRLGSNQALAAQMGKLVDEFAAGGMTVTKFEAEPAIHGFDIPEFREWLVFVPCKRTVRRIDPDTGLTQWVVFKDYQVAVRKKEVGSAWSFINGSRLKIPELRTFFPSLPNDIEEYAVPAIGGELLKK
ncbi:MAG: hypothetical protein ACSHYB_03115 [Roseibacillus sp.]